MQEDLTLLAMLKVSNARGNNPGGNAKGQ
jgi:hypothetical protein